MAAVLLAVLAAGCGRRTAPRPLAAVAPSPQALEVRQLERDLLLSWRIPGAQPDPRFGGLEGWVVTAELVPAGCLHCPPLRTLELHPAPGDAELRSERGRAFYRVPVDPRAGAWRFRVAHRFGDGTGGPSSSALARRLNEIPAPAVRGRRMPADPQAVRPLRLEWDAPQEALVQVLDSGAPPAERALHFRANVYRRRPTDPWPFIPRNGEPLAAPVWQEVPAPAEAGWEYAVRLVDRFGGEGPLSDPVFVPSPETREP